MKRSAKILRFCGIITLNILCAITAGAAIKPTHNIKDTTKDQPDIALFAPGIVPGTTNQVAAPAFSPDGKIVYFGQSEKDKPITLVVSYHKGKNWSTPVLASFSGNFENLEPAFSPDGKYLIFASNRPKTEGAPVIDGSWNGQTYPGKGGNLWKVTFTKKGPGKPERLPDLINSNNSVFSPAVIANGTLFFMRIDTGKRFHIHRSEFKNGQYQAPVLESFCLDKYGDFDPVVAPDGSFLIFSSPRPPALPHTSDIFIVFRTPSGTWGEPVDLRQAISDKVFGTEARLSPDNKTLYFSNQRNAAGVNVDNEQYIWQVDISKLLKAHGL